MSDNKKIDQLIGAEKEAREIVASANERAAQIRTAATESIEKSSAETREFLDGLRGRSEEKLTRDVKEAEKASQNRIKEKRSQLDLKFEENRQRALAKVFEELTR